MSYDPRTYYRDHWLDVEPERMARYEAMFQWRDGHDVLIAPADVREGHVVADFGCGPGGLAMELARRVGRPGRVIAMDINRAFLDRTRASAASRGFADRVETRLLEEDRIPLDDCCVDRLICKNVLEYVPDPQIAITEFRRVLRPGGIAHVSDSDWGAVMFEPARERFERIMAAATIAFRSPLIGRSLYGMFRHAGFDEVRVQVLAAADVTGALRSVWHNMAGYARASGHIDPAEVDAFLVDVDRALEQRRYLAVLPQFLVTGIVSEGPTG